MNNFDSHLGGMADNPQFFIWRLVWDATAAKYRKTPCKLDGSPYAIDASLPANWTDYDTAVAAVAALPQVPELRYALGFWMTADCGYWFLDVDNCVQDGVLLPFAQQLVETYPGAFCEWSSSGKGLHIIGMGNAPDHRNKPERDTAARLVPMQLEFYSSGRGIAFGLTQQATGCADVRFDVSELCATYFPPRAEHDHGDGARVEWRGPADDDVLIERMLSAKQSAAAAFGGKASLPQLWRGEVHKDSDSDMSLAGHLAWWTGCDEARIERLMRRSGLLRPKWDVRRPGGTYLSQTIERACTLTDSCYQEPQQAATSDDASAANLTTELSNAYRLHATHGDRMMSVPGIGWHIWNDVGPWIHDDHAAYRLAFGLGKAIQDETTALDDWVYQATLDGFGVDECKRREQFQANRAKWAKASESKAVIDHSLSLAGCLLSVPAEELDASPLLIGCPSGVIDLASCTMREHRKEDRITKRIACNFDPAASAPIWERFLSEVFGGDDELLLYVQTLVGYMLSGVRGEHLLPVMHGSGANGKSTFLSTIQALMGDYAGTATPGLLISHGGTDHPTGLASLQGRRLVVASETGEAGKLNEDQVKLLTGGDRITARRMRQDFYEFEATHLIVLQTNHKPRVTGTDEGIWRRVKLIPFNVTIATAKRDPELPQKLAAEFPGILAWAIKGWRNYQLQGFREPAAVREATADYRSDSDHVGAFLSDRCLIGQEHTATASAIYNAYKLWCAESGERPLTQRSLGLRLSERPGIVQTRTMHARTWRGLATHNHAISGQKPVPTLSVVKTP